VLPEFLDVVDDPLLKSYNGKGLVALRCDDEGVPAQAVKLIVAGNWTIICLAASRARLSAIQRPRPRRIAGRRDRLSRASGDSEGWADRRGTESQAAGVGQGSRFENVYYVSTMGES